MEDVDGAERAVHWLRRRHAHERAAQAHEQAAVVDEQAATFMDEHDRPERAAELRAAAERHRLLGVVQRRLADSYADPVGPD